jgi:hypothetical protein
VLRNWGGVGAFAGVVTDFANAFGFWRYSRNFLGFIRSLTINDMGSDTLSSRTSYLRDLDDALPSFKAATSGVADLPRADLIAA